MVWTGDVGQGSALVPPAPRGEPSPLGHGEQNLGVQLPERISGGTVLVTTEHKTRSGSGAQVHI